MNHENIMRRTMLNLQQMFCAENGIEYVPPKHRYDRFDEYYNDFTAQGYTTNQAQTLAWERCEREKEL